MNDSIQPYITCTKSDRLCLNSNTCLLPKQTKICIFLSNLFIHSNTTRQRSYYCLLLSPSFQFHQPPFIKPRFCEHFPFFSFSNFLFNCQKKVPYFHFSKICGKEIEKHRHQMNTDMHVYTDNNLKKLT
jgi:hypothetical protein